jgi:hypothetical protein
MNTTFDPFNDRMARDIRNSLSTALVSDLEDGTASAVDRVAGAWMRQELRPSHRDYIRRTLQRYRRVAGQIRSEHIRGPRCQALVLWNAGLFFELHELLETVWRVAGAEARTGLKGLIQAAGVYVHQLRGNAAAAQGLALRARRNLRAGRDHLAFVGDLDRLIQCLEDPSRPPPTLQLAKACDELHG